MTNIQRLFDAAANEKNINVINYLINNDNTLLHNSANYNINDMTTKTLINKLQVSDFEFKDKQSDKTIFYQLGIDLKYADLNLLISKIPYERNKEFLLNMVFDNMNIIQYLIRYHNTLEKIKLLMSKLDNEQGKQLVVYNGLNIFQKCENDEVFEYLLTKYKIKNSTYNLLISYYTICKNYKRISIIANELLLLLLQKTININIFIDAIDNDHSNYYINALKGLYSKEKIQLPYIWKLPDREKTITFVDNSKDADAIVYVIDLTSPSSYIRCCSNNTLPYVVMGANCESRDVIISEETLVQSYDKYYSTSFKTRYQIFEPIQYLMTEKFHWERFK